MELFRLFGTVLIDDKDAIQSLKNVDDKGKTTKASLQDIADKGAKIGAAVLAGTGVAIGGLLAMASSTSDNAAHWLELSQRTDISIESLERWGYAAGQSGADIDSLEVGMKKLSTNMQSAITDSGASRDAFEKLGVSMDDLSKMSPEQTFDTIMNKLADMPDGADKNVVGNQLLGKSYTELKPLLSEGSDGMQDLKDQADKLGIVMSGESVTAAEGFGDTMDNVKATFDGVKNKLVMELIPQLTNMLNWFIDKAPQIQSVANTALGAVSDVIGFITDNSGILIPILGGLLGAFLAMKAISTVTTVMDLLRDSTILQTIATQGLNTVLKENPLGIIITLIGFAIAAGIAIYQNWDTIKAKAKELWDKITEVFNGIKEVIGLALDAVKTKATEIFDGIKTAISDKIDAIKNTVSNVFNNIKDSVSNSFDSIKTKTSEIWDGVKSKMSTAMDAAKETVKEKLGNMKKAYEENGGGIKGTVAAAWEGIKGYYTAGLTFVDKLTGGKLTDIKNAFSDKMNAAKDAVSTAFESAKNLAASKLEAMKTSVSEKINAVKTSISTVFGTVKDVMTKPFETARDAIKTVIDKVKSFLNFNWEFPKLKMPHFTVSGSMNPMKWVDEGVPKIGVSWYKNGGIFSKPTIFNTPYGLKGVGDAKSPEVVAPLDNLNNMISGEISKAIAPLYMNQKQDNPIIETGVYLTDGPIIKVTKRAQTRSGKRIGYTVTTT